MKKVSTIFLLLVAVAVDLRAQLRVPPFELNVKGTFNALISDNNETLMIGAQGGIDVPINQYIAVGWMYARTFYGSTHNGDKDANNTNYDTQELITGPEIRISTGRSRKFRPYGALSYTRFEIVTDYGSYRNANKTTAWSVQAGLMMKLGGKMYWNLVEAAYRTIADEPFWIPGGNRQLEFKTGLTYNFGRRK